MSLKRDRDPPSAAAAGENKRHKSSSHNSSNVAATSSSLDTGLETNETDLPTFSSSSSSSSSSTTTITANPVISRNLAHQLLYGKHNRFFFPLIFKYLSPNQSERIELRSFCKFFRKSLLKPFQIWTRFPQEKHATWESLINAVNVSWEKDPKKAPTLIIVRRGGDLDEMEKEDGEYVPFYNIILIVGSS